MAGHGDVAVIIIFTIACCGRTLASPLLPLEFLLDFDLTCAQQTDLLSKLFRSELVRITVFKWNRWGGRAWTLNNALDLQVS